MELEELIYKHALANAVKHDGKAQVGPVVSKVLGERPELKSNAKQLVKEVEKVIGKVNSMTLEEQLKELREKYPEILEEKKEEEKKTLPPLPNVKGRVVTRFAPNPDGPLHLGNARAAVLSHEYARIYKGDFILRFDDTDPKVKRPIKEAYDWIREDLRWLGFSWKVEFSASSRLERYYEVAKELISKGNAYVDLCSEEEFKKMREAKRPCPNREKSPEDNLELWDKMLSGHFKEGEAVVRVKTRLDDPDPSKVDWVMLRIVDTEKNPHPLVGSKYFIWPTYNFASAVDDHDFDVTHILRAKEHMANGEKQRWIFNYMGWEVPEVTLFGRLKLEGFMMSKSKIRGMLEKGTDRDDPRLPTLAGLRRRGILPETVIEVILEVGVKGSDATISFDNLAAINRKKLDQVAKRLMFVKDYKEFELEIPEEIIARIPIRPNSNEYREIHAKPGDKVLLNKEDATEGTKLRLLELCNVEVRGDALAFISKGIDDAKKLNAKIVQWVKSSDAVDVKVIKADPQGDLQEENGKGERAIGDLKEGEVVQFIRYGFVRVDANSREGVVTIFAHD
ncbi:MAG: glutamate--tRNA ligase [Candidatus Aramenus sp.]|jgi:glutamyl-tRNA synthetase|nr:glutamate--tRNA ligase [Candidatus Aramenus sp.]